MTIDWWTLGLEAINVAVLVWLLGRFFWTPVVGIIEKRQAAVATIFAKADARGKELDRAAEGIASSRAGFAAERAAILADARKQAEAEHAAIIEQARSFAAGLEATAQAAIKTARAAERKAWTERSARLAVSIASKLAARLDGPAVDAAFLDWLIQSIKGSSASRGASPAHADAAFDAISARCLDEAGQRRVSEAIADALGSNPLITFKVDPSLIAGIELHGSHFILRNSWRADLDHILEELDDEG